MMNRTVLRIFIYFVLTAAAVSIILLIINFVSFAVVQSDPSEFHGRKILSDISESLIRNENGFYMENEAVPDDCWCILLNDEGDVVWSHNKPEDIPVHYSLKDIARISKWFLNDYPVYMQIEDYGLIILGTPKNSVGKYFIEYSNDWFDTLPVRLLKIIIANIGLACVLACIFGIRLYRRLKMILNGINDLKNERNVYLKEKGIFKELCRSINETSQSIERKNRLLSVRDNARSDWIAGVSHDIRTPLALVIGNAEAIEGYGGDAGKRANTIKIQGLKIKKIIEDLNIISSLEYDMQPLRMKKTAVCPLIRRVAADIINSGLNEKYTIDMELGEECAYVTGDEALLERALFNVINNAVVHNENGCNIKISQSTRAEYVIIIIKDNGKGIDSYIIENMENMPKSAHGIGLPVTYRIINMHGGSMKVKNNNGTEISIMLRRLL